MKNFKYLLIIALYMQSACHSGRNAELNQTASVTSQDQLPDNPLMQKVISTSINSKKNEMSTLYGNDTAYQYARMHQNGNYITGSVLYLVTWKQQNDPRWFGGKIPHTIQSVEIVRFRENTNHETLPLYQLFKDQPLHKTKSPADPESRVNDIVSQRLAPFPPGK